MERIWRKVIHTSRYLFYVFIESFFYSIVLIGIAGGCSTEVLQKVLESIYFCLILIVGIEEIKTQRNIERLKRELRVRVIQIYYEV